MNKVESLVKKKSILLLNDFYGKIMTNMNYLIDYLNDYQTNESEHSNSKLKFILGTQQKEKFGKIYSLTNETRGFFQSFYSNFSEILKVRILVILERR